MEREEFLVLNQNIYSIHICLNCSNNVVLYIHRFHTVVVTKLRGQTHVWRISRTSQP